MRELVGAPDKGMEGSEGMVAGQGRVPELPSGV